MTFKPKFHCDGPTCIRRITAEDEHEMLTTGWIVLRVYENPEDEDTGETSVDFCSFDCATQWWNLFSAAAAPPDGKAEV